MFSSVSIRTVIFDLDGTIADVSDRRAAANEAQHNFLKDGGHPNNRSEWWAAWQDPKLIRLDKLNHHVVGVLRSHHLSGCRIIITSARNDKNRDVTVDWLEKYGIPYHKLYMRPDGEFGKDSLFKEDLYKRHLKKENILAIYDDRNQVVDMWRDMGLPIFQVCSREQGNF